MDVVLFSENFACQPSHWLTVYAKIFCFSWLTLIMMSRPKLPFSKSDLVRKLFIFAPHYLNELLITISTEWSFETHLLQIHLLMKYTLKSPRSNDLTHLWESVKYVFTRTVDCNTAAPWLCICSAVTWQVSQWYCKLQITLAITFTVARWKFTEEIQSFQ